MRKKKYIGGFLFFILLLTIALPVCAQSGWELRWGNQNSDGSVTLTESRTNASGSYVKSAPVDTRKGFTLSFDYLIDQVENGPSTDMGISVNFSEKPALSFTPYFLYYGVRFLIRSGNGYVAEASLVSGHDALVLDDITGSAISPLEYGEWHSVQIKYAGGVLEVWEGGLLLCRSSKFRIPDMAYVGICARTDYWPRERHMIRNVSFTGALDAALVYLNANGGVCETKSIYAIPGETADLTEEISRTGYAFNGWYAEPSCVNRVDGRSFNWSQGQTVYAGWTPEQYVVTFDPQTEDVKMSQITVSYEKPYGTLPTPKRTGFVFDGWFDGGKQVKADTTVTKVGNHTLYAHWTRQKYKVTYNAAGGKVSPKSEKIEYQSWLYDLPTPKRKNYVFLGWYTKKKGGKRIDEKQWITKKVTYYAHWGKKTAKVKIKLNKMGGSCKISSITTTYGGKLKGLPKPARKGYRFDGWYTEKYVGVKVTASSKTTKVLPRTTLYAHWKKESSGGSGSSSSSGSGSGGSDDDSGKSKYRLPCLSCDGSGKCSACGGDGYRWSYAMDNERLNCYKCNGSGRCTACGGSGKR